MNDENRKRQLLADLLAKRITPAQFKKALTYPLYNPIVLIYEPQAGTDGPNDNDICSLNGNKLFEPFFYDGMKYGEYRRRCLDNPNDPNVLPAIVFYRSDDDERLQQLTSAGQTDEK